MPACAPKASPLAGPAILWGITAVSLLHAAPAQANRCRTSNSSEIGGALGINTFAKSINGRAALHGNLEFYGALEPVECLGLPLRIEAGIGSSTRGPPWGGGGNAVEVKALTLDLRLGVGSAWRFASQTGALEWGVGPIARIQRVKTRVANESFLARDVHLRGLLAVGLVGLLGQWRVRMRLWVVLPNEKEFGASFGLGYAL